MESPPFLNYPYAIGEEVQSNQVLMYIMYSITASHHLAFKPSVLF